MRISDILTTAGLLTAEGVRAAARHQAEQGGSFCDSLVALGIVSQSDLARTLVIVSSKSGTTLEPNILKAYFWERLKAEQPEAVLENLAPFLDEYAASVQAA